MSSSGKLQHIRVEWNLRNISNQTFPFTDEELMPEDIVCRAKNKRKLSWFPGFSPFHSISILICNYIYNYICDHLCICVNVHIFKVIYFSYLPPFVSLSLSIYCSLVFLNNCKLLESGHHGIRLNFYPSHNIHLGPGHPVMCPIKYVK